jgi:TolB-like protein
MRGDDPKAPPPARIELAREVDFALGPMQVSPSAREVVIAGMRQVLQPRVMQVLVALAQRKGEVVSRDQLVMSCWGGRTVSEDAIQRSIASLRRLAAQENAPLFAIETVARVGYRLVEPHAARTSRHAELADTVETWPASAAASPPVSIAVLPFLDMSPGKDQEYFADGLSEELLNQLTQIRGLRVAARTSCFAFKGLATDVRQIGERLGVDHLLEGSVRKAGNRLRITAQLVTCSEGYHLWSHSYDCELNDVFAIQESIARAVAEALSVTLRVDVTARAAAYTTNLEAYDKYLRARALFIQGAHADLLRAAQMFREALALDPDFAAARASLAFDYTWALIFAPENSEQTIRELDATVRDALTHAPDQWASHLAHGVLQIVRRDWHAAEAAFKKVWVLAPSGESNAALVSTYFSAAVGRSAEAVRMLQDASKADPLSVDVSQHLQQHLDIAGRSREAQAEYERTKGLARGRRDIREHQTLQRIWDSGDEPRIKAQARRFLDTQATALPAVRAAVEILDQPAAALSMIRSATEDPANQDSPRMMILAWYAAHFGDDELALRALRRSYVDMKGVFVAAIWYPVLREVRKMPAFKDLLRDLGLADYWRATGNWGDFARPTGADDFECR